MFVYYNQKGVGDVLLLPLKNSESVTYKRNQDIATIIDEETNEIIGYNIFNASNYFNELSTGKTKLTEDLLIELKKAFELNNLTDKLDIDLSPKFVVGYVSDIQPHENADKLRVCHVDVGTTDQLQIVCGAPNVDKGQKVVVARVGAIMPSGLEIKPTKLRGVDSHGMICSQKELGFT
ncbi:YtpR family tRNA-binding protein [Gracilibacillus kekensis]|uniref:tRNA-binding protein n=1 Tax=Gracilibacillus kekensis TaxID=1027249 RepID=A0A1M7NL29_9BACI|nr:tRNA-binding protein [Gracilibacillus kekensis]